jgi:pimeloyl-ACP methyl ester carboxylesterase
MKALLSLLLMALALLLLAGTADASLKWKPCDDGFECATAKVPLDYAHPHGRQIDLALLRARAQDPSTRIGSVFVNPGGPGSSGVDFIRGAPPQAIAAITRRFDVIGVDTRGSGHSRPRIDCDVDQERLGVFAQPLMTPDTLDVHELVDRTERYVQRCAKRNGELLEHVSSADVARDLDRLRTEVGDKQLNFIGHSYSTMFAATYASMFPGRVRTMVLDSPIDADTWVHRPFQALREQTAALEHALDRFFAASGVTETEFDELLARLDDAPLGALDGADARLAAMAVVLPVQWPVFETAIRAAENGDGSPLRAFTDEWYSPDTDLLSMDLAVATQALDQLYPHRVKPFLRAGRVAAALFDHFALNNGYTELPYGLLPVSDRSAYHGPFRNSRTSGPALVIGTVHDPLTPYVWAQRLTHDLGNARLLTYDGDGHGSITALNPCIVGTMLAYLEAGALPPEGTVCR